MFIFLGSFCHPDGFLRASIPNSAKLQETFALPFTLLPTPAIVRVLEVPQFAVVMLALPLKEVPLIVLAVCNVVDVDALPERLADTVFVDGL